MKGALKDAGEECLYGYVKVDGKFVFVQYSADGETPLLDEVKEILDVINFFFGSKFKQLQRLKLIFFKKKKKIKDIDVDLEVDDISDIDEDEIHESLEVF